MSKRYSTIGFYLSPDEKREIEELAYCRQIGVSQLMRELLLPAIDQKIKKCKRKAGEKPEKPEKEGITFQIKTEVRENIRLLADDAGKHMSHYLRDLVRDLVKGNKC